MPSLLTQHYRSQLAGAFFNKLKYAETLDALAANGDINANGVATLTAAATPTYLYLTAGRSQEWVDASNGTVSDSNPPIPTECIAQTTFQVWHDMLAAKRAYSANVAFVVPRTDWVANTVYDQYDDTDTELADKSFFVLDTSDVEYRVYKCLWNNRGATSTNSPSLIINTNTSPVMLADGYTWQFLYALQSTDKFLTNDWMPVYQDANVATSANALAGTLIPAVPLVIEDGGGNYNAAVSIVVTIRGDGQGANVAANGATVTGGQISSVILANGGFGYSRVSSINVYQLGATSATARAIIPPYPNHGYDAVNELYTKHLMVHVQLSETEDDKLTVNNDYRQVGLLINPIDANTGALANGEVYRQTYDLTLTSNTGPFSPDDVIFNSTIAANAVMNAYGIPSGTVVDTVLDGNSDVVVRLTDVNTSGFATPFAVDDVIKCNTTGNEGTVNTYATPELVRFSGDVLYINQRQPITRDELQYEEFKVILPFGG